MSCIRVGYYIAAVKMASQVPAAAGQAIKAAPMFIKYGTGVAGKFSLGREVVLATLLGTGLGLVWKVTCAQERT